MIKQIKSNEIVEYIKNNKKCVLLDVRTEDEWKYDGKPDGNSLGIKTYFLPIQSENVFNQNFVEDFKKLNIDHDHEILTICMSGGRSQIAAEILSKENFNCSNISDGFLGNQENIGWKQNKLPTN